MSSACARLPADRRPPKLASYTPAFRLPTAITAANYKNERDVYDALPVHTAGRDAFRRLLQGHLMAKLETELRLGGEADALRTFIAAITIYHPTEIYADRPRETRLAQAAGRIAKLFSPRGDEEQVLLALFVRMTVGTDRAATLARIRDIVRWVDQTQQMVHGPAARGARLLRVLEKVARRWPSAPVVERLRELYLERRQVLARAMNGEAYRHLRLALPSLLQGAAFQTGVQIARLYLRVGRPYQALNRLRELGGDSETDSELRQLLEQAVAPTANVQDQVRVAEYFEERDRVVALRTCEAAVERFSGSAAGYECLGRIAAATKRHYMAVSALERAVQLAPEQLSYAEALARSYQSRLFELIGHDQLDEAEREMTRVETFYRRTEQRFRKKLKPSLARAHFAIALGYFNAGRVTRATSSFQRSLASEVTPESLVQLATIRLKKLDPTGAIEFLNRAERSVGGSSTEHTYWRARLHGMRGRALDQAGQREASLLSHRKAVEAWREWRSVGLRPSALAEAYLGEAHSLYALGQKGSALDAIERAIDAQPDRKETYADAIAMLITHGHLPEALDALHRALGRSQVSDYLKTYCSLWVIGLARRGGLEPDALAMQHLRTLSGTSWYVRLAQLTLGRASYDELLKEARTVGNQAELNYYWADHLLSQGKLQAAQALWRKVLESNMLGFYEYEMSFFNLRHGAATVSTRRLDRQSSR